MISRIAIGFALFSCILFAATANAQPGDRRLDIKARVLDTIFPLDVSPKPYFLKMVLRFDDSGTELIVVVYPGGKGELIRYSLMGMNGHELSQLIAKMVAEDPEVTAGEIAVKLKVDVSRSPIKYEALSRALDELKSIQISPVLVSRVAVDASSEYEFWYDTWQESVHYTIIGPLSENPQDRIARWMLQFRANLPELLKAGGARVHTGATR